MINEDQELIYPCTILPHTHELVVKADRSEVGIVAKDVWEIIDKIQKDKSNSPDIGNFKMYNCMFTDSFMWPFEAGKTEWVRIATITK